MFRKQALESKKSKLAGDVILNQPISMTVGIIALFTVFSIIIVYLTHFEYARKEVVQGYLVPDQGLIKLYSERSGVLDELYVEEGQNVLQGQPLARIKNSQAMADGKELSQTLEAEIQIQIASLNSELSSTVEMYNKQAQDYQRRIQQLESSSRALKNVEFTNTQRLKLKKDLLENNEKLHKNGYLSSHQLYAAQGDYLELVEVNDRLKREYALGQAELNLLRSELSLIPQQRTIKEALVSREISELRVKLADLQNQYEFVKLAPEHGMVTAIQPSLGSRVSLQTPILNIIPANSLLQIELLLPTRSAGFVRKGDRIKVRFDAFPYQKFGLMEGEVTNIDKALILPTQQLLPLQINEAMYRVRASLNSQAIEAYGKSFPLKVGMIAEADIILEKRTLLEWLLDPLYAIKGRI